MTKVFVYGTLKEGFGNHRVLRDSRKLCDATIEGFDMISLGAFPGIITGSDTIYGEVYEVTDTSVMRGLDSLEGHRGNDDPSSMYYKKLCTYKVETKTNEKTLPNDNEKTGQALVYVYNLKGPYGSNGNLAKVSPARWVR